MFITMGVFIAIVIGSALLARLADSVLRNETSDDPWIYIVGFGPAIIFWMVGASEGASAFSNVGSGGVVEILIQFFALCLFEMFWCIFTVTEGFETIMLGGYDLNGYEPS